ncbi:MAG: redoxin family protein [Sphingobacterium sp.]|jgi:carboxyl-terminal processing protease|nr:redoxin family protein [Sphingobacterium sp.]
MIRIPKTNWRTKVFAALFLITYGKATYAGDVPFGNEQKKLILKTTMYYINQKHVHPAVLNDDFSIKVWQKYFDYIDINHKIFLKEDIEKLRSYQTIIDDEVQANSVDFFNASYTIYAKRMSTLRKLCDEILNKPFSFSEAEYFQEQSSYPATLNELKERWRKSLKFSVLKKYAVLKQQGTDKKDALLEKESRMAVKKWMNTFFDRMLKPEAEDVNFSYFINAILFQIDPHSIYNMPIQAQQRQENISKRFFGIGISMKESEGEYFIDAIIPGGAASNTGFLHLGDQILQIENAKGEMQDIFAMPNNEVIGLIRGTKDSNVRLRIKGKQSAEKIVSIKRTELKDDAKLARSAFFVKGAEKIGIIHLPDFYDDVQDPNGAHAAKDVMFHIEKLKKEGMTSLIIDLRDNPGGSLNEVVRLAGALIGNGPKVQIKGRTGVQVLQTEMEPIFQGPLAVMVNERSASASEIFAAVIQDYQRGIVIGGPTSYGKGTAQEVWPIGRMADESKNITAMNLGSLALTSYLFYRVTGQSTQRDGVRPDILLPSPSTYNSEMERDYSSALPNIPIPTLKYEAVSTVSKEQIDPWNKKLQYSYRFNQIDSLSKLIATENKAPIALNLSAYQQQLDKKKMREDKLSNLLEIAPNKQVDLYPEGAPRIADKWYKEWLETIKKDIYVAETCGLLEQWSIENQELNNVYTIQLNTVMQFFKEDPVQSEMLTSDINDFNLSVSTDTRLHSLQVQIATLEAAGKQEQIPFLLQSEGTKITKEKLKTIQSFIQKHPESYISLYLLANEFNAYTADGYEKAFEGLSPQLRSLTVATALKKKIADLKITTAGTVAIDFQRTDQHGKQVKLSDLRGKYVLLDFWGSWCVPCRRSHPHLKELYQEYKDRGFEILAIANEKKGKTLEERKKTWMEAIHTDEIPWIHVLADEGSGAPDVLNTYGITGFPTKILLDREGRIVMRTLGNMNDELDEYLKKHI